MAPPGSEPCGVPAASVRRWERRAWGHRAAAPDARPDGEARHRTGAKARSQREPPVGEQEPSGRFEARLRACGERDWWRAACPGPAGRSCGPVPYPPGIHGDAALPGPPCPASDPGRGAPAPVPACADAPAPRESAPVAQAEESCAARRAAPAPCAGGHPREPRRGWRSLAGAGRASPQARRRIAGLDWAVRRGEARGIALPAAPGVSDERPEGFPRVLPAPRQRRRLRPAGAPRCPERTASGAGRCRREAAWIFSLGYTSPEQQRNQCQARRMVPLRGTALLPGSLARFSCQASCPKPQKRKPLTPGSVRGRMQSPSRLRAWIRACGSTPPLCPCASP